MASQRSWPRSTVRGTGSPLVNIIWAASAQPSGSQLDVRSHGTSCSWAAGAIAAFGVIYAETTLIVGAMAISPDTLPISATATALFFVAGGLRCVPS